jgi:hypothetical protein
VETGVANYLSIELFEKLMVNVDKILHNGTP